MTLAFLAVAALLAAGPLDPPPVHVQAKAVECDSLSGVPLNVSVDYATQVKPLFGAYGCIGCHNGPTAAGGLDLGGAQFSELCSFFVASVADGSIQRVAPTDPVNSLLYQKVACNDPPGFFGRMPPSGPLTLGDQALIHDWIAQGARGDTNGDCEGSDWLFRDGLESTRD